MRMPVLFSPADQKTGFCEEEGSDILSFLQFYIFQAETENQIMKNSPVRDRARISNRNFAKGVM